MAKYFTGIPIKIIGIAKIIRDVLITVTAVSTVEQPPGVVLTLMVVRESVGAFIKYAEEEVAAEEKAKQEPKPEES